MPVDALAVLERPLRRRLYLAAWKALGLDPGVLEAGHLGAVDALLGPGRCHRQAPTPGPGAFVRSYGDLWALVGPAPQPFEGSVTLPGPGRTRLPGTALEVVWGRDPPVGRPFAALPPGGSPGPLSFRSRRPGDRLGKRKVKDLLMEARLPRWRRSRAVVVEGRAGEVVGVLAPGTAWPRATPEVDGWVVWLEGA